MTTLILYATKHGAAREVARRIAAGMDGAVTHDLKESHVPALDPFECVVVGSSLYAGRIRREAKVFLLQNAGVLQGKKLGLFLCGMDESRERESLEANCPADLLAAAKAACFLGGIFDPRKAGAAGRLVMKAVRKPTGYVDAIDNGKIKQFVETMRS